MDNRITIMMDEDIYTKLRNLQSKIIKKTKKSCSFSKLVNEVVVVGLKHPPKKKEKKRLQFFQFDKFSCYRGIKNSTKEKKERTNCNIRKLIYAWHL